MSALARVRRRTRLRHRFRAPREAKQEAELRWWLQEWDPVLRAGALSPGDALAFLDDEDVAPTYLDRRWQQARAEVRRVLREAAVDDERFFDGKVVVDIGPGPLGFPDACPGRVSIGVEPLAARFAELNLLLPDSPALYLSTGAEHIPLLSGSVDVVVARNSLDHVDSPEQVLSEAQRLLRPGGTLILNFDIDHTPTPTEPHALTVDGVCAAVSAMTIVHEDRWDRPHGSDGHAVVLVARSG
jgi:SAM-dependent methyltransferase